MVIRHGFRFLFVFFMILVRCVFVVVLVQRVVVVVLVRHMVIIVLVQRVVVVVVRHLFMCGRFKRAKYILSKRSSICCRTGVIGILVTIVNQMCRL